MKGSHIHRRRKGSGFRDENRIVVCKTYFMKNKSKKVRKILADKMIT